MLSAELENLRAAIEPSIAEGELSRSVTAEIRSSDRRAFVRRFAAILASVVGALIFTEALARVIVGIGSPRETGSREFDAKWALANGRSHGSRPVVFCIGSSLTSKGIYADLLSARLTNAGIDVDVKNLASSGAWPMEELLLLKRAIAQGEKPQAVICDVVPNALDLGGEVVEGYQPRLVNSYVGKCLLGSRADPKTCVEQFLSKTSFLYGHRAYLKEQLAGLFGQVLAPHRLPKMHRPRAVSTECSPRGWAPSYRLCRGEADFRQSLARRIAGEGPPRDLSGKVLAYEAGRTIQRFCAERSIPLLFVWLPVHPLAAVYYRRYLNLSPAECHDAFAAIFKRYGLPFLDLHDTDHDPLHFANFDHLNAAGAVLATEQMARALQAPPYVGLLKRRGSDKP